MIIDNQVYCYWDSQSDLDAAIILFNVCIAILLALLTVTTSIKMKQKLKDNYPKTLFIFIYVWAAFYVGQGLYGVISYFSDIKNKGGEEKDYMNTYSRIFAMIDTIPGFLIQFIVFHYSLKLLQNTMHLYEMDGSMPELSEIKIYSRMKRYQKVRWGILPFSLLILVPDLQQSWIWYYQIITEIKIVLLMIDCTTCIFAVYYSRKFIIKNTETLLQFDTKGQQTLSLEIKVLIFSCVGRLILDFLFYIIFPILFLFVKETHKKNSCISNGHLEFTILYLLLGPFFMHFSIVFTILRMYKVEKQQAQNGVLYQIAQRRHSERSRIFIENYQY